MSLFVKLTPSGELQLGSTLIKPEDIVVRDPNTGMFKTPNGVLVELPSPGLKNKFINSSFAVNQQNQQNGQVAVDTLSGKYYTFDYWKLSNDTDIISWTTEDGSRIVNVPVGGITQVIYGQYLITGKYVCNWEGTSELTINGNPIEKGVSFDVAGGADLTAVFSEGTLSRPQLEYGELSTSYEVRDITIEELLCMSIFEISPKLYFTSPYVAGSTGTTMYANYSYKVPKRTLPVIHSTDVNITNIDVDKNGVIVNMDSGISSDTVYTTNLIIDARP